MKPFAASNAGAIDLSSLTRSAVFWSAGALSGMIVSTARSRASLGTAWLVEATSGTAENSSSRADSAPSTSRVSEMSAVMTSGPLKPGPNPLSSMSYAVRAVVPSGS